MFKLHIYHHLSIYDLFIYICTVHVARRVYSNLERQHAYVCVRFLVPFSDLFVVFFVVCCGWRKDFAVTGIFFKAFDSAIHKPTQVQPSQNCANGPTQLQATKHGIKCTNWHVFDWKTTQDCHSTNSNDRNYAQKKLWQSNLKSKHIFYTFVPDSDQHNWCQYYQTHFQTLEKGWNFGSCQSRMFGLC